jgi:gamma-glutamylcyclotransferase (GGCT)/AIG2-like uncharacterized protein YtfP
VPEYLFAYGTLQPGLARLTLLGPGTASGTLYDLGDYPGAMFGTDGTVHGRVYELPADPAVLARFDRYEGVPDLYVRRAVPVILNGGRGLTCWAYHYNQDLTGHRRIPSGVYVPEHRP